MSEGDRMARILSRLVQRTKDRRQDWNTDTEMETAFWTPVGSNWVRILSVDADGQHPYRLSIFGPEDDSGPELESLGSLAVDDFDPEAQVSEKINRDLATLYELARSNAMGVAAALDEVEEFLDQAE